MQELRSFCDNKNTNGRHDMAFLILHGDVGSNRPDESGNVQLPHVKPACSSLHLEDVNIMVIE